MASLQKDNERNHKVRVAIGNGVRTDIWSEFISRFGNIQVRELYAATEGNIGFINYTSKIGAVGRVNFVHRVSRWHGLLFWATIAALLWGQWSVCQDWNISWTPVLTFLVSRGIIPMTSVISWCFDAAPQESCCFWPRVSLNNNSMD